jgi:hypothetical protein
MSTAVLTALLGLALLAGSANAQPVITKSEAYKQARHCLLASGKVRSVGRWGNGGGFAYFHGYAHIVYWAYHLDNLGQVGRVRLYAYKLPARKLNLLRRCTYVP